MPAGLDPAPYVAAGRSFASWLQAWRLPPDLFDAVVHAIALLPEPNPEPNPDNEPGGGVVEGGGGGGGGVRGVSCAFGLGALFRHLRALGQFGTTAFLAPIYG